MKKVTTETKPQTQCDFGLDSTKAHGKGDRGNQAADPLSSLQGILAKITIFSKRLSKLHLVLICFHLEILLRKRGFV